MILKTIIISVLTSILVIRLNYYLVETKKRNKTKKIYDEMEKSYKEIIKENQIN